MKLRGSPQPLHKGDFTKNRRVKKQDRNEANCRIGKKPLPDKIDLRRDLTKKRLSKERTTSWKEGEAKG